MGIQGLLPFLKKSSVPCNIRQFKGSTVAIDSYCWLHRGAFACAEKLALGENTDQYVYYCLKYINTLLANGIKPIMVFDGCRLPSKHEVEKVRREKRDLNRKKAAEYLRQGLRSEARDCLAQCIDITPLMALQLMIACREKGIDCIVAPYEADAQLAYLNKIGIADLIITEDSDLILFGCEKILFKMDFNGNGILIERDKLNLSFELPTEVYNFEKCRNICILSGCDYLQSLPGIGLARAHKVFKISRQEDIRLLIRKMPSILKMPNLPVTDEYIEAFIRAENTFLYQLVYNPIERKIVPLNPYPPQIDPINLKYAGPAMTEDRAFQIALGNINVNTGEIICDFDPDLSKMAKGTSIWHHDYQIADLLCSKKDGEKTNTSTRGKELIVNVPSFKPKHIDKTFDIDVKENMNYLSTIYDTSSPNRKKLKSISPRLVCQNKNKNIDAYDDQNDNEAVFNAKEDQILLNAICLGQESDDKFNIDPTSVKDDAVLENRCSINSLNFGQTCNVSADRKSNLNHEIQSNKENINAKDLDLNSIKLNCRVDFHKFEPDEIITCPEKIEVLYSPKKKKVPTATLR